MNIIKELLFGTDRKKFSEIKPEITKSNRLHLMVFATLAALILVALGLFATFIPEGFSSNTLYFSFAILSFTIAIMSFIAKENHTNFTNMCCFLFMIIILLFGMFIGILDSANSISTVYVVLVLAVPLLFILKPVYVNLLLILMTTSFLIADYGDKTAEAFRNDAINSITFTIISIVVGSFIIRSEIASLIAENEKQHLMDQIQAHSITDSLTGLNNRNAYEDQFIAHPTVSKGHDFVYVSIDLNGLKVANDTYGHSAGDELIKGAADCMRKAFNKHGNLYRVGGDEFVAIIFANDEDFAKLLDNFETEVSKWKGNLVTEMSVAVGYASANNYPDKSVDELSQIADKFMYEDKNRQYLAKGIDRQGQKEAYMTLCDLYTKILRVNLDEDSFSVINVNKNEMVPEKGFTDTISGWLKGFAEKGQVHPDDKDKFLMLTDLNYIKKYFELRKKTLNIYYRRKFNDDYKEVMMEIVPSETYSEEKRIVFFYIIEIDR